MKLVAMILLIGGAVMFFQSIWFMLNSGIEWDVMLATFVLYSMLELWLHKKGKV